MLRRLLTAIVAGIVCLVAARPADAGPITTWSASSGLYPDQIASPWTTIDTANPENPVQAGGILTLATSAVAENLAYLQTEPVVDTGAPFFFEARLRFVSGQSTNAARAPVILAMTTAPSVGNALFIGQDQVFFNTGDLTKGPAANVQTDDAFHTYRIEFDGGSGFSLFYDGNLTLSASTFTSAVFNGPAERLYWGENSVLAFGVSEWEFVRHDAAAVPEPGTLALVATGLSCSWLRRKFAPRLNTSRAGVRVR
jgi:hypothetical protein